MKRKYIKTLSVSVIALLNLTCLNAQEDVETVNITLPKVAEAPKVDAVVVPAVKVVTDGKEDNHSELRNDRQIERGIGFSKRVPPKYDEEEMVSNTNALVGEVKDNRVPAYLRAPLMSKDDAILRLKRGGFTVLASYELNKGILTSIVFTNEDVSSSAAKETRGFAGSLRLMIDKDSKTMSISNPLYVMKAFMQEEYNNDLAKKTLASLRESFNDLQNSEDVLKVTRLEHYQFMMSMPYYEDMEEIASGSNQSLLQKARDSKKVVYEHHLSNGSVVIGVKLSKRTSKFVKKIGYQNGGLLPYPILIENNKAYILAPKYYIAVMYPMLSMSQFMGIATIPGAIEKECDKVFR